MGEIFVGGDEMKTNLVVKSDIPDEPYKLKSGITFIICEATRVLFFETETQGLDSDYERTHRKNVYRFVKDILQRLDYDIEKYFGMYIFPGKIRRMCRTCHEIHNVGGGEFACAHTNESHQTCNTFHCGHHIHNLDIYPEYRNGIELEVIK